MDLRQVVSYLLGRKPLALVTVGWQNSSAHLFVLKNICELGVENRTDVAMSKAD
jgi:hypothetical protein